MTSLESVSISLNCFCYSQIANVMANYVDPDQMQDLQHLIWVCTDCQMFLLMLLKQTWVNRPFSCVLGFIATV